MKTVLITGVNGFIGSHLAAALAARGLRVLGSTSHDAGLRVATPGVEQKLVLTLGRRWAPDVMQGVDTVVHCAWDLRPRAAQDNIVGTQQLVEAAESAGVKHQVFISTNSAHPSARSDYGKSKLAVQEYVLARGHAAARPGLVIGPGGMFRRLAETLGHHRAVPVVDGGRGLVPVVAISDLQQALAMIVEQRLTGQFNLFNPDFVTLREVVLEIRATTPRRALLVPVPSSLLLGPLWLMEKIGIKLPINVDNLRGMRANFNVREASDLPAFVPQPVTLTEMVRAAGQQNLALRGSEPWAR